MLENLIKSEVSKQEGGRKQLQVLQQQWQLQQLTTSANYPGYNP